MEEEVYGAETIWRTTGKYMSRIEQYRKSLYYYDEAVKKCPKDTKTLVDRSIARTKVCEYAAALDDIDRAVKISPNDIVVLASKAQATYLSCEIEQALIQNYRLLPRRQQPNHFKLGIMYCISALEHSLGDICGRPLRDHFLVIRKQAWLKAHHSDIKQEFIPKGKTLKAKEKFAKGTTVVQKMKKLGDKVQIADLDITDSLHSHTAKVHSVPPLTQPFRFAPLQRHTNNLEKYMSEKYLERLYSDSIFLDEIQNISGITIANIAGSNKIKFLVKDAYRNTINKQEVLRTRRPFYYLKFQEAKVSGALKFRQDAELHLQQENVKKEADKIALSLELQFKANNLDGVVDLVEKLKLYCDSKPKRLLPEKDEFNELIYDIIRKAFYNINRLNHEQTRWDQDKRILVAFGQSISRDPSNDSVICCYNSRGNDFNFQQLKLFQHRLDNASNDDELCWFYHEVGRYGMLSGKYDEAKNAARGCVYAAEVFNKLEWVVNGSILLARLFIRLKSRSEALDEIKIALKAAENLKDIRLKQYLQRCSAIISDLDFDDTPEKRLMKRQDKILALMTSDKLKGEFAHLFQTMKAMPTTRRISIIPGGHSVAEMKKKQSVTIAGRASGAVRASSAGRASSAVRTSKQ